MATAKSSPEAARLGREAAFNRLVDDRALDAAYRYATILLGNRSDAEDATHDAAVAAWRHLDDLRDESRFDAWFGRILVNACRDRLRRRGRITVVLDEERELPVPSHLTTPDPADAVARRQTIAAALRELNPSHREAIVLRYFLDLSVEQIAARTGANAGTVKSRLHYALLQLRASVDSGQEGRSDR